MKALLELYGFCLNVFFCCLGEKEQDKKKPELALTMQKNDEKNDEIYLCLWPKDFFSSSNIEIY